MPHDEPSGRPRERRRRSQATSIPGARTPLGGLTEAAGGSQSRAAALRAPGARASLRAGSRLAPGGTGVRARPHRPRLDDTGGPTLKVRPARITWPPPLRKFRSQSDSSPYRSAMTRVRPRLNAKSGVRYDGPSAYRGGSSPPTVGRARRTTLNAVGDPLVEARDASRELHLQPGSSPSHFRFGDSCLEAGSRFGRGAHERPLANPRRHRVHGGCPTAGPGTDQAVGPGADVRPPSLSACSDGRRLRGAAPRDPTAVAASVI